MLGDNQNQKDTSYNSTRDNSFSSDQSGMSNSYSPLLLDNHKTTYTKTNRLITALYMVTDIMEKDEPLRLKLRTLGVEILSDVNLSKRSIINSQNDKINAVMSFLNIGLDMGMISDMNCRILMKEFSELKDSIRSFHADKANWLEEFISTPEERVFGQEEDRMLEKENNRVSYKSFTYFKGHPAPNNGNDAKGQGTRLGVQKAHTLLNAIGSIKDNKKSDIKDKRREEILSIIKSKQKDSGFDGVNVSDIRSLAKGALASCGDKTIQRELISMLSDGILAKRGEKRWTKYLIAS